MKKISIDDEENYHKSGESNSFVSNLLQNKQ